MRLTLSALILALLLPVAVAPVAGAKDSASSGQAIELQLSGLKTERGDGMEEWFTAYDFDRIMLTEKKTASGELHGRAAGDNKVVTADYSLMVWFQMDGGLAVQGTIKLDDGDQRVSIGITGRVPSEGAKRVIGRATKAGGMSYKVQASFRAR